MSGFLTAAGADYLMNLFGGVEDPVSQYWVALVTTAVGTAEDGTEISEPIIADYGRAVVHSGPENWVTAYGALTNVTEITFPIPGIEDWTGIIGWAMCDAETAGRVFWAGDFESYDVAVGDQVVLPIGSITLAMEMDGWREVI